MREEVCLGSTTEVPVSGQGYPVAGWEEEGDAPPISAVLPDDRIVRLIAWSSEPQREPSSLWGFELVGHGPAGLYDALSRLPLLISSQRVVREVSFRPWRQWLLVASGVGSRMLSDPTFCQDVMSVGIETWLRNNCD